MFHGTETACDGRIWRLLKVIVYDLTDPLCLGVGVSLCMGCLLWAAGKLLCYIVCEAFGTQGNFAHSVLSEVVRAGYVGYESQSFIVYSAGCCMVCLVLLSLRFCSPYYAH